MSEPFLGEIKLMAFGFAPKGWALCNGQLLPINQNQALFSLLGTTYGGDGRVNFRLPNLQGQAPVHFGGGAGLSPVNLGETAGEAVHTLTIDELPAHAHTVMGTNNGATTTTPAGNVLAVKPRRGKNVYSPPPPLASTQPLDPRSVSPSVGNNQAHENRQPFLVLNFVIALQGIFPSQN